MFVSGIKRGSKKVGARVSDYIGWKPEEDEFKTTYFGLEEQGKRIEPDYDNPANVLKAFRGSLSAVM